MAVWKQQQKPLLFSCSEHELTEFCSLFSVIVWHIFLFFYIFFYEQIFTFYYIFYCVVYYPIFPWIFYLFFCSYGAHV